MDIKELKNFLKSNYPDWILTYEDEDIDQRSGQYTFEKSEDRSISIEVYENSIREIIIRHPYISENSYCETILFGEEECFLFPRAIELINKNTIDLKIELLEKYLEASKKFKRDYEPILIKYNFFAADDDLLSGDVILDKKLKYSFSYAIHKRFYISFFYDLIEDTIFLNDSSNVFTEKDLFTYSLREFEESLRKELYEDRRTRYLVSDDPKWTENTWYIINILLDHTQAYRDNRKPYTPAEAEFIDINQIPDEYKSLLYEYQILKEQYEKSIKENSKKKSN